MKKVLCVIDGLSSGGAQRQLVGLAVLLSKHGYDVSFLWYHKEAFYKPFLEENQIRYLNPLPTSQINKFFAVAKVVKQERPDVVISYIDSPNMICCVLRKLGIIKKLIVSERSATQRIARHEKIKFFLYRFADYVVANSNNQGNFITKRFPLLTNKVKIITNFVDTDYFIPDERKKHNEERTIICVGRIIQLKNIIRLMNVVSVLKERGLCFKLKWFGSGDGQKEFYKQCKEYQSELNIGDCFVFCPATNDIKQEYQKADILWLGSLYEGFPNVICEAMSCGLPIVCSNVCDNPYIVKSEINGLLFDPMDEEDMTIQLQRILTMSDDELKCYGRESRKLAIDLFSKERFINKYTDLI